MQDLQVEIDPVPVHVAIIMDGNGRWARQRKRPRLFGHKAGVDSVRAVVEAAREIGVKQLPKDVQQVLVQVMNETRDCVGMRLNLALSYGSRAEIIAGMQEITRKCSAGVLDARDIDEQLLSDHLYSADQPDPDLLIRTGGEHRLSNFLLWQVSYAEIYFSDTMWPDYRKVQFLEAIKAFGNRQRRFGRTSDQLESK